MFHRQLFEEMRRVTHLTRDPTESVAMGAVEASFKCCASAIVVLTKSGRSESTPTHAHTYTHIHTYTCTRAHTHTHILTHIHTPHTHTLSFDM